MSGSKSRSVPIPDDLPPGGKRDWLEWLQKLRRQAGLPSLEKLAQAVGTDKATISRLLKGQVIHSNTAQTLAYKLAELSTLPVERDWDAFDAEMVRLHEAAINASIPAQVDAASSEEVQQPVQTASTSAETMLRHAEMQMEAGNLQAAEAAYTQAVDGGSVDALLRLIRLRKQLQAAGAVTEVFGLSSGSDGS